ncbi:hypothetical protein HpM063_07740 [Helicobacter pylori]
MAVRFGVIFIHDSTLAINRRAEQLRSILECKRECNFIWFDEISAVIQEQVNEEIKLDPSFCNHRVSSEQNRKINEIAEGLKSGKIFGKKIIANAFDLNASYCFITLDDLKNLKERLFIQQDIINAINQRKRVALDHAQIDDIKYNLLNSAFYFIFDVGNSSQLAIKVPRKYLENDELPNTKKNIFSRLIRSIHNR